MTESPREIVMAWIRGERQLPSELSPAPSEHLSDDDLDELWGDGRQARSALLLEQARAQDAAKKEPVWWRPMGLAMGAGVALAAGFALGAGVVATVMPPPPAGTEVQRLEAEVAALEAEIAPYRTDIEIRKRYREWYMEPIPGVQGTRALTTAHVEVVSDGELGLLVSKRSDLGFSGGGEERLAPIRVRAGRWVVDFEPSEGPGINVDAFLRWDPDTQCLGVRIVRGSAWVESGQAEWSQAQDQAPTTYCPDGEAEWDDWVFASLDHLHQIGPPLD